MRQFDGEIIMIIFMGKYTGGLLNQPKGNIQSEYLPLNWHICYTKQQMMHIQVLMACR